MALADDCPNLAASGYRETSPKTQRYNCIAWANERDDRWWEPIQGYYWPDGIPLDYHVDTLVSVFEKQGYALCSSPDLEPGFEKVAIYAIDEHFYEHAARQTPDGKWSSKLGSNIDMEHNTLDALAGPCFGRVVRLLKRAKT